MTPASRSAGSCRTGSRRVVRFAAVATLLVLVLAAFDARLTGVGWARAQDTSREYLIKAAFIYNFAKFTEWPVGSFADAAAPIEVCVLGEDPFGAALDSITGKEIRGRSVTVRRIGAAADGRRCHLVFISESESGRLAAILDVFATRPVLTIADMPDFARTGGIINLKTNEEDRVRFEINVDIARRAGLRLSSKLLSLAEIMAE